MLTEILQFLRNWFCKTKYFGEFTISEGALQTRYDNGVEFSAVNIVNGQYFRIIGSAFNDGVWKFGENGLTDEIFSGAVWVLAIPPAVVALAKEIADWQDKYGASVSSPWQSESYARGSYSRSKVAISENSLNWRSVFEDRLSPWRKI